MAFDPGAPLHGITARKLIRGTPEADDIYGGNIAEVIDADAGDDYVYGGAGDDIIMGGDGNDELRGGENNDVLDGGSGNDTLKGDEGDDDLRGGSGDDTLVGGNGSPYGSGADTLDGGEGNDYLFGDDGDDSLLGGAGNDTLHGNADNDHLEGGDGDDVLFGDENSIFYNPTLDGDDTLLGGAGNDRLFGGGGSDVLNGGAGIDRLTGGPRSDIFVIDGAEVLTGQAFDTITDFKARSGFYIETFLDQLDLSGVLDKQTHFAGSTAAEALTQGYIVLRQFGAAGHSGYGTKVFVDANGAGKAGGEMQVAFLEDVYTPDLTQYNFIV